MHYCDLKCPGWRKSEWLESIINSVKSKHKQNEISRAVFRGSRNTGERRSFRKTDEWAKKDAVENRPAKTNGTDRGGIARRQRDGIWRLLLAAKRGVFLRLDFTVVHDWLILDWCTPKLAPPPEMTSMKKPPGSKNKAANHLIKLVIPAFVESHDGSLRSCCKY